jgi:hypothetical protein
MPSFSSRRRSRRRSCSTTALLDFYASNLFELANPVRVFHYAAVTLAIWTEADLHERFANLNALRLPEPCRTLAAPDLTLVDSFPLVFACLTGSDFNGHLPPRFFVTPYDDSQDFGHLVEYKADLFR